MMEEIVKYLEVGDGHDLLSEAARLNDVCTKSDPENEPFRSKYAARKLWEAVKLKLSAFADKLECEIGYKCILAALDYNIAVNHIDTEETQKADVYFHYIIDTLREIRLNPLSYGILHNSLNQLGFLLSTRDHVEDGMAYLEEAQRLYEDYKSATETAPHTVVDLLKMSKESEETEGRRYAAMEEMYTYTLYYMAQAYANLRDNKKSAYYCNITLKRQLESIKYDPDDWALNAATLSQFYISANNFDMSRHCLASASQIFSEALAKLEYVSDAEGKEGILRKKADIERCWIKYGLALLEASQDNLVKEVESMNIETSKLDSSNELKSHEADATDKADRSEGKAPNEKEGNEIEENTGSSLKFDLDLTRYYELMPDKYVLTFAEARDVFLSIQKWIKSSQEFYTFNDHCVDYVEIAQDYSRAFKLLRFFEGDLDRQCRMEKRRAEILSSVLDGLNPRFYLQICKSLTYELAEIHSLLYDLKLALTEGYAGHRTLRDLKKINVAIRTSVKYYDAYLDLLKDCGKPNLPADFHDGDLKTALLAVFCTGRLHSKILTTDKNEKVANIRKSLESYSFVVRYCESHPEAGDVVPTELSVCKEMTSLLPIKIERILTSCDDF